jgi:hypothetical protein
VYYGYLDSSSSSDRDSSVAIASTAASIRVETEVAVATAGIAASTKAAPAAAVAVAAATVVAHALEKQLLVTLCACITIAGTTAATIYVTECTLSQQHEHECTELQSVSNYLQRGCAVGACKAGITAAGTTAAAFAGRAKLVRCDVCQL